MRWGGKCFDFFMGVCFSCRKSRLNSNHNHTNNSEKTEYISSSATPLHVCGPVDDDHKENSTEIVSSVESNNVGEINHHHHHHCQGYKKMSNPIKGLVSKRRKRYTQDGFNLDLTCILSMLKIINLHNYA